MDILNAIREAQGGNAVQQLGNRFGLQPDQVSAALSALVPALAAGFQNNMSTPQGMDGLLAQVRLRIGDQMLTAVITSDAVRALKLRRGQDALAIIKSTEVMIARSG